jgi:hypothetical protein
MNILGVAWRQFARNMVSNIPPPDGGNWDISGLIYFGIKMYDSQTISTV